MVEIVTYHPGWPAEFIRIASDIRAALGPLALRIDHIGSTSVPNLSAKDVIDVQITVASLDDNVVAAMNRIGYTRTDGNFSDHVPPGAPNESIQWEKFFFRPPPGHRRSNTHMRIAGRANQRYPLLFRDYLRVHPATAAAYAELKRRLAEFLRNTDDYPDVKDPAVDLIYLAAEEWATATGWQIGPADA